MILLAVKNPTDKGKAFEEFISILLSKSGYRVIGTRVRKAGRELDITATSKVTGAPVLIECKAESRPVASTPYNKFYGIFEHEAKRVKGPLVGLLISLSGFNGDVLGNYQEKSDEEQRRFKIHGHDFVIGLAVEAGLIVDDATVRHLACRSWPFSLGEPLLIITKSQLYRVQILQRNATPSHFIVYRANGDDPTDYEIRNVRKSTKALKGLESYNLLARKQVLTSLAKAEEYLSSDELAQNSQQSVATIENEIAYLKERKLVSSNRKKQHRLVRDIRTFCEISMELLASDYAYDFLLSEYFTLMNNRNLAGYCLSRRSLGAKDDSELDLLCSIFRFSPSALTHALFADATTYETTYNHAKSLNKEIEWLPESLKYSFIREMIPGLLADLREGNKVMDSLDSVVGFLEAYHLKLANSLQVFFDIQASGISTRMKAGEDLEAGHLVTVHDPLTRFNIEMTQLRLTGNAEVIDEMIKIYRQIHTSDPERAELPGLANNIGVAFMAIQEYGKAKNWLDEGLKYQKDIPELHANMATVEKAIAAR